MNQHIYKSWVLPFRSRSRLRLFGAQFLGAVAVGFLGVFVTLDMLQFGEDGMLVFTTVRFGIAGFVAFPLITALYLHAPRSAFRASVMLLQGLALVPLFYPPMMQSPFWIGSCMGVAGGAYWQALHLAMTAHASDAGRGYEVTLSQIMMTTGAALGFALGGWCAAKGFSIQIAAYAVMLQLAATLIYCRLIPRSNSASHTVSEGEISAPSLRHELFGDSRRTILTMVEAVYTLMADILRPAWLKLAGVAALGVGLVSAIIIVIQAVVAPLAGKFYHNSRMAELRWGSLMLAIGWVPWVASAHTALLLFSVPLWAAGAMMVQTGLGSRWYRDRSATAILAREMLLTLMRVLAAICVIPLMFHHTAAFAALVVISSLLLLLLASRMRPH